MNSNIPKEWGVVHIYRPAGCERTDLSLNALDENSRRLARETFVEFNGKLVSCVWLYEANGYLTLRIPPGCFRFMPNEEVADAKS